MTEGLARRFRYNAWANETLARALAAGPAPVNAIRAYAHVQETEIVWARRILGVSGADVRLWSEAPLELSAQRHAEAAPLYQRILAGLADGSLPREFAYRNSQRKAFTNPVADVLEHVLIHSAQYRGEAAAFAIAAGCPVPDLDLIIWIREGEPVVEPDTKRKEAKG